MQQINRTVSICREHLRELPSSLIERDGNCYIFCTCSRKLEVLCQDATTRMLHLDRPYRTMGYDPCNRQFYALSCSNNSMLYILSSCFYEIDHLKIAHPPGMKCIKDLAVEPKQRHILMLSADSLHRFNENGDYLGVCMTAPGDTKYQAITTYEDDLFLSYVRSGCAYVASYTQAGALLERLCLGSEYTVLNLQVFSREDAPVLRIYALKNHLYLFALDVVLQKESADAGCQSAQDLEYEVEYAVECASGDADLKPTCFISQSP